MIAANRDEVLGRESKPLDYYEIKGTKMLGGRDVQGGGGSWMAVSETGFIAIVTNNREVPLHRTLKSRGELVNLVLSSADPVQELARFDVEEYSNFNLLLLNASTGTCAGVVYYRSTQQPKVRLIEKKVIGLSNGTVDSCWPKEMHGQKLLKERLSGGIKGILECLLDTETFMTGLPSNTALSLDSEERLSSIFTFPCCTEPRNGIDWGSDECKFGTVSSAIILVSDEGATFHEVSWRDLDERELRDHDTLTNGKNKYCRNFAFSYKFDGRPSTMVMTSVLGHVKELDFPTSHSDWQAVPFEELLDAPILAEVPEKMQEVADNLRCEAKKAQMLIIWTDCDREGEYIGNEIRQICLEANPRLEVFRARYSVLNATEMHRSMRELSRLDQRQVSAAELRSELDLRGGAAFTRLQTLSFRGQTEELRDRVVSYGSCQFPTLGFVVEQYLRVLRFEEEPFWYIQLELKGAATNDSSSTKFSWSRHRLFDRPSCIVLYERCLLTRFATIIRVDSKPTTKWRPLPLRTVELQKFGSRYLKMSSDKIMEVAERLYNQGFISYPRTETDMFESTFDLRPLLSKQVANPKWGSYATGLLEDGKFRAPRRGKNNDKAHPPIHPTKDGQELTGLEAKVYEFITRRFIACCSEDAKGLETIVVAQIGEEEFRARGVLIEALNYLEVYIYETWNDQRIGFFQVNEQLLPHRLEMLTGKTARPKLLSESELIGSMDKNGIGTDATIHEHIKKLIERSYVSKTRDSRFHPTNLGLALVQGYDRVGLEESLTKPKLRALLEQYLSSICNGTMDKAQVASILIHQFRSALRLTMDKLDILHNAIISCSSNGLLEPAPLPDDTGNRPVPLARRKGVSSTLARRLPRPDDDSDDSNEFRATSTGGRLAGNATLATGEQLCNCQRSCKLHVVKKEGPNKGRHFWGCSDCNFFQWSHEAKTQDDGWSSGNMPKFDTGPTRQDVALTVDVRCNCGQLAAQRTVSKDGPNRGRQFYVCAQAKENSCQFFSWTEPTLGLKSNSSTSVGHPMSLINSKFGHSIKCGCEMEAVREVTRGGANAGKPYYRCPKTVMRCGFFKWEDDGRLPAVGGNDGGSFAIACYRCGQEGHFANTCTGQAGVEDACVDSGSNRTQRNFAGVRGRAGGRGGRRGGGYSKRSRSSTAGPSKKGRHNFDDDL